MVLPHRNSHRSYQFRLSFFWALFLGLLLLPACRQAAPEPVVLDANQVFEQDVIAALPAPQTYRIGINTEVTGTGAQIGDLSLRAARLAIEEINAAGGVNGVPLELIVRDARSDPAVALAEYKRAVAEDDLDALLGPFKSAFGVRIVPEHIGQPLPMFIGATNVTLTQRGDPHLFRMRPSDQMTAPAMLAFILEQLPTARIGLIHDTDAFGSGGADRIEADLAALGRPVPLRLGYVTGTTEFDGLVQQLAEAQVEAILIYGTNQTDVGHLLRAVRYWDLEVPIVTSPVGASVVTRNVAGEAQDDIYAVLDANLEAWPKGRRFQQAFLDRFGLLPDTYITWYYDAIHLLAQIWSDYPEARGEQLSQLIRATQYEGAQGVYCFDEAGEGLHRVTIAQVVAGQLQPVMVYGQAGLAAYGPGFGCRSLPGGWLVSALLRRLKRQFERRSLATQLALAMLLVGALTVAVQFYDLNRQNRTEIEALQTNTLINEAQTLAQRLDALVVNEISRITNLSFSRAAQQFISVRPDQRSALFTPTLADFTNFLASNSFYRAVLLLDPRGEVLISTEGSYVGQNFANSAFFRQALQGEAVMSDLSISRRDRQAVIWLAAPVYTVEAGALGGVVAVSLSPEEVWHSVESYTIGQAGYAILLDEYGIRLAHGRDRRYIFRSLVPLSADVWTALQQNDRFGPLPTITDTGSWALWHYLQSQPRPPLAVSEVSEGGPRVYYSAAPLTQRQWTVVAMLPEREILAPVSRVTLRGLWAGVALTLFLGLTAVWMARRIVRPVPKLVQAARKIAQGDLTTPVQAQGSSELAALAENFEVMRGHLQDSRQQLTAWAQELEQRVAQRSQEVTALSGVIAFAGRSQSRTELLDTALHLALRVMDAEMGGIWMAEPDGTLWLRAQQGFDWELGQELTTFAPDEGLLGQVQRSGRPVALADISQAPLLARAVVRERDLHAFAAVPLHIHGRNLGVLGVFSRAPQPFSPEIVSLAAAIAQQIALTLDNMALFEQVESQAHSVARLQERERIAAEIHDSMAQTHGYVYLQVDNLAEEATVLPRSDIQQRLTALRDIIAALARETRQFIAQLRDVPPPPPTRLDETVRREIERLQPELRAEVSLDLSQAGDLVLSDTASAELARIIGEAVRNAQRHGQAHTVRIGFERHNGDARLSIQDDGQGFDPTAAPSDGRRHFGLSVMQARAARLGGSLTIDSRPGTGTAVRVQWPLADE